jgi:hypothetical protein
MTMRDSELFDQAVTKFFEPIARKIGLPLSKVRDGVYEIHSPHFIMRIRLDTGHARGLNVILREASLLNFDENEPFIQYGIGCFMQFHGEKLEDTFIEVNTNDDFLERARLLAQATEHHGVPYLLGQEKDFNAIKEMVKKGAEKDIEEIKKYRFPKNVRKEWI